MNDSVQTRHDGAIAIVGLAGRFPGAATVKDLWRNLTEGVEAIQFASAAELSAAGIDPGLIANPDFIPASSRVRDPEFFDASFFGFSAREAEILDPQQRVFLECAWEALEDAACDPSAYAGAIGVFAGAGMNTYGLINLFSNPEVIESAGAYQVMVGNDKDFLCSRVSYKLNLKGPAIGVQTACSTSLVAVQTAFESLRRNECDMALAGGVSIPLPPSYGYLYVPGMILSRDGHCRAFDAAASGTVPGGGAGVAVLKRLGDAIADGDPIYAVIRGAAINNDGAAKVGYSAPSVEGQSSAIRKSMQMAGFEPETIGYVEAHGTGTEVGDPIEVAALAKAFNGTASRARSCALGSIKTNLGHLDTAAGIAGLIKTALCLKYREIPPTLHFTKANPLIEFANTPFYVNTSLEHYDKPDVFRAGVSSFGIGGTNAHVSLEEPPTRDSDSIYTSQLIVLSAKTSTALEQRSHQLLDYLHENPSANLADLAFTLQKGRQAFRYRRALVADDVPQLAAALRSAGLSSSRNIKEENAPVDAPAIAFLFPGQGAQYLNMGRDLYKTTPIFRETVDRCCEFLKPHLNLDLRMILYPAPGEEPEAERLLNQTSITQPGVFVIEYAMAALWMDCGLQPAAMVGHSIGEYTAACIAGVFSLEDALSLIAARGRLVQSVAPGAMLAVSLPEHDLLSLLSPELSIAAVNSPSQTVASGIESAIAALEATLKSKKIDCKRLRTSHAFHSPMMEGIVEKFVDQVRRANLHAPKIRYLSNVTGTWATEGQCTSPKYWGEHLRRTVRFSDCSRILIRETDHILLEVGPGDTLISLLRQQLEPRSSRALVPSMRHRLASQDDRDTWLAAFGRLWLLNTQLNWHGLHRGERRLRLSLPTYPFERQRYWIEPNKKIAARDLGSLEKQPDIADWFYVPSWKRSVAELLPVSKREEQTAWLVFIQEGRLARDLTGALSAHGRVVQVRAAEEFRQISPDLYEIDPASAEDYAGLIRDLEENGISPQRVVHAWMLDAGREASLDRAMELGVLSVLSLVQSAVGANRSMEWNVVGNRGYSVFGEPISLPAVSALNAFCGAIPAEYPNIACRTIDVDLDANCDSMVQQLMRELLSAASNETVAYRGSTRWVRQYESVRLEKPVSTANKTKSSIALRRIGNYLISGGLGGVGLVLARHLARTVNARIVLTARTPLPPAQEWESLLNAQDTPEALRQKLKGIRSIEEAGGKVLVLEADVADPEAMRRVVLTARAEFGQICGIVHAAGIGAAGVIQTKSREEARALLTPKVQGTEWLREPIASGELDFVLLCSSISAVIPSFGLSDYASANAYLDGFAAAHDNPSSTRVLSANWDTWSEVGMAADARVPAAMAHLREERLKRGIQSVEAEDIFDRLLHYPLQQTVISTRNFHRVEQQTAAAIAAMREDLTETPALNIHSRPVSIEDFVPAGDEIERFIIALWEELLGMKPIGIHDNFFELGGHSLLGTQVLARLRERYRVSLSLRIIFEATTPADLAQHIRMTYWASSSGSEDPGLEREEIEI